MVELTLYVCVTVYNMVESMQTACRLDLNAGRTDCPRDSAIIPIWFRERAADPAVQEPTPPASLHGETYPLREVGLVVGGAMPFRPLVVFFNAGFGFLLPDCQPCRGRVVRLRFVLCTGCAGEIHSS